MHPHAAAAVSNLKTTYMAIGLATEGSRRLEMEGSLVCVSRHDHPVGNFAIVDRCSDLDAKELALYAGAKNAFHLYVSPEAAENGSAAALAKRGFRSVHTLQLMWTDSPPERNPIRIDLVSSQEFRQEVANYMADQFFARRGADIAQSVAQATAASGLDLCEIRVGHDRVGVVMLARNTDTLGIYNLVVAPNLRKKGYGAMALRQIRALAKSEGLAVTLQCDKSLSPWYEGNEFAYCGEISVYVLERR